MRISDKDANFNEYLEFKKQNKKTHCCYHDYEIQTFFLYLIAMVLKKINLIMLGIHPGPQNRGETKQGVSKNGMIYWTLTKAKTY